jgi:hypothetical protein
MALERALIRPTTDTRKFDPTTDTLEVSDIDYVGAITIGTVSSTGIDIGKAGILTTIKGDFQVDGTSTLVDTITAQGDVNLGDGGDTINLGFDLTDVVNFNTNLTGAAGTLIDLVTNGAYLNLPTEAQAVAVDGTDGYLRLNVSGAPNVLEFLDIGVGWVTVSFVGSVTLDDAYNASGGASTITVDAGDVTWNEVGAYSFVVDVSGCTGVADGFFVEDGTDYFRLTHKAANTLALGAELSSVSLSASLTADIDAVGALSLNSSGGVINIGNDAVAQNINIGTAGARAIAIGSATATAITLDAIAISLDASNNSNYSISANDAGVITLTLSAVNAGAGKAYVDIYSDDSTYLRSTAGTVLIDAGSNLELNSSGGVINIGNDAVAQNINIGTAGARAIAIGSATATAITLDAIAISLDASNNSNYSISANDAGVITLTLSAVNAGAGKAYVDIYSDDSTYLRSTAGTVLIDAGSNLELNSSGGVINIGNDAVAQNINIGTAGARAIAIGSATATAITLDAVGGISLDAEDTSDFVVQANSVANKYLMMSVSNSGGGDSTLHLLADDVGGGGACNMVVRAGTNITIDAGGVLELNSSAGVIGIGNDAVAQNINIGTGAAARTITVGNTTGATGLVFNAGTGDVDINASSAIKLDGTQSSNWTTTTNFAGDTTLTIAITNAGAGDGNIDVDADGAIYLDAAGRSGTKINTNTGDKVVIGNTALGTRTSVAGDSFSVTTNLDASFSCNAAAAALYVNDAVDTDLVGFASASIVGALNELKEGYLAYGVYNVVANTYAFNDFTVSVILVDYTATGTCTVTIDSDQIAVSGRSFVIKDSGQNAAANNITVETEGAETIEGEANFVINTDGGWLTFVSDGTNLHLI